ncbi:Ribose import permease protein RbsC [bioreactor metagenome]|uniref:Ribose import permease protein RbsC n=1 Tax=bioreactor metagenome TaxID=1076179 RepID=A0A645DR32_9ZZZZ
MINKTEVTCKEEDNTLLIKLFYFIKARFYFIAFIIVFLFFSIGSKRFLSSLNLTLILVQASVMLIAAMGETFVILAGSIDLAVGSIIGIGAAATAVLGPAIGMSVFPLAALIGGICGSFSGLIFSKGRIPSFMATLASMTILRGLVYIITKGVALPITLPNLRIIGIGKIYGIPISIIVAISVILIAYYLCHINKFGFMVAAIGGNEKASDLSGIKVDKIKFLVFILSGIFAGLAGAVSASRTGAGSPYAGLGFETDVITCVVLGGTAMTGGIGGVKGTIIGTLIIAMLSNGLDLMGVDPYLQTIVKGIVLWLAVIISIDRQKIGVVK